MMKLRFELALVFLTTLFMGCGKDDRLERVAVQSQDYVRQHLLAQDTCKLPGRRWDPRGAEVVSLFRQLHAQFADGPSLDPDELLKVRILRFVSSEEMASLKGKPDTSLALVPLGMVRSRFCIKKPFGGEVRWIEMYFLDPDLETHDSDNAAIMRSPENRQTVFVHEALHALGYQHFEGNDLSQSLRDGAAGSRFVFTRLRGRDYEQEIGESFREDYLAKVPRVRH